MKVRTEIEQFRQEHYNATIISIRKIHPDLWIFRVRPNEGVEKYAPGQYTTLGLGDWEPTNDPPNNEKVGEKLKTKLIRRAYSFSYPIVRAPKFELIAPEELDYYEFYIALVSRTGVPGQEPSLTPRLFALKEGDGLWVGSKVTGHYILHDYKPEDRIVFAATGTGEAPHNCMINHLLRHKHTGPILSVVCVRYDQDLAYKTIHQRLAEQYPNYHYITLTTREAGNLNRKVYIQDLLTSGELEDRTGITLDPANTHVYLCGNPAMIGVPSYKENKKTYPSPPGLVELLESRGFTADYRKIRGNIHFEEYW